MFGMTKTMRQRHFIVEDDSLSRHSIVGWDPCPCPNILELIGE